MSSDDREITKQTIREQLESVVLIECLVRNADNQYTANDFGQPGSEQAAYLETYLTADGKEFISLWDRPDTDTFIVAFYLHFYDPAKPFIDILELDN
jgi:hypothetical protein